MLETALEWDLPDTAANIIETGLDLAVMLHGRTSDEEMWWRRHQEQFRLRARGKKSSISRMSTGSSLSAGSSGSVASVGSVAALEDAFSCVDLTAGTGGGDDVAENCDLSKTGDSRGWVR